MLVFLYIFIFYTDNIFIMRKFIDIVELKPSCEKETFYNTRGKREIKNENN